MVAAYDLSKNKPLQESEIKRLEVAMQRINKAVEGLDYEKQTRTNCRKIRKGKFT